MNYRDGYALGEYNKCKHTGGLNINCFPCAEAECSLLPNISLLTPPSYSMHKHKHAPFTQHTLAQTHTKRNYTLQRTAAVLILSVVVLYILLYIHTDPQIYNRYI